MMHLQGSSHVPNICIWMRQIPKPICSCRASFQECKQCFTGILYTVLKPFAKLACWCSVHVYVDLAHAWWIKPCLPSSSTIHCPLFNEKTWLILDSCTGILMVGLNIILLCRLFWTLPKMDVFVFFKDFDLLSAFYFTAVCNYKQTTSFSRSFHFPFLFSIITPQDQR